jgi:hypothetical protein
MNPIINFAYWIDATRMDFPIPVTIYNVFADIPEDSNVYNVLNIVNEPEPTRMNNKKVLEIAEYFNLILTWDKTILKKCNNAKFFPCGMSWIDQSKLSELKEPKEFGVTFVCGTKNLTSNHRLRHELWYRQKEIKIPYKFYNSSHNPMMNIDNNPLLGPNPEDKLEMFNYQYHIAIENSSYDNYFTEKLMDCFITKTIPIYLGCPNIDKFFNINGIICVDSVDTILGICNNLITTSFFYNAKQTYVDSNFKLCQPYIEDFTDRLYRSILEEIVK